MYWWQRISRIFIQKSVLLKGQFHQIKITIFHVFNLSVDIRMCKKLCCVIDTAESRSVVSLILWNHDYWHHGHNRVRLCGVIDIVESRLLALLTQQSQTQWCHWYCGIKITGIMDTTESVKITGIIDTTESDSVVSWTLDTMESNKFPLIFHLFFSNQNN